MLWVAQIKKKINKGLNIFHRNAYVLLAHSTYAVNFQCNSRYSFRIELKRLISALSEALLFENYPHEFEWKKQIKGKAILDFF